MVAERIVADRMGYMYAIEDDHITKYSPEGDSMFYYSNKLLGHIDDLDVTLAMRPLIFYKNTNQVIVTDNTLSPQLDQTISLEQLDWQQVTHIAPSFNNNKLWLYDQANFELLLVNRQLNIEQRSGNLLQIINTDSLQPTQIREHKSKIFLNNPEIGIHVFDLFGTYYNTLHIKRIESFELYENMLISVQADSLCFFDTKLFSEKKIGLPIRDCASIAIKNDLVYCLRNDQLYRYRIKS